MTQTKAWLFVAWAPHGRRSELLADELNAKLYFIHYLKFQTPRYAPVKYILQTIRTLQVLFWERPVVVFVQSPPFVCSWVIYLYCSLTGAKYVLDHHTASFAPVWNWALPAQKFVAQRAVTNIVTNQHWVDVIERWSANAFILPDPLVALPKGQDFLVKPGFNVVFINTFAPDEPIEAVLEAAAQLPDVHFYITGNTKKKPDRFFANTPANVTFTGFIPDEQYFGLLRAVQVVLALTTRNFTLQGGGCEAISLGKPLITSDWPYLRELFAKGTLYVPNTAIGIRDGILTIQKVYKELEKEVIIFRQDSRREWDTQFARLKELIANPVNDSVQPKSRIL